MENIIKSNFPWMIIKININNKQPNKTPPKHSYAIVSHITIKEYSKTGDSTHRNVE